MHLDNRSTEPSTQFVKIADSQCKTCKTREFNAAQDYKMVCEWWTKHPPWQPVPLMFLPPIGIVAEVNGQAVAAGWLYQSGTVVSWAEWFVGNPDVPWETRDMGLDAVVEALIEQAASVNAPVIFSSSNSERLLARLEKHGFKVADRGVCQLWRG